MMGTMSPATAQDQVEWHNDGHSLTLRINRQELDIVEISCPHGDTATAACQAAVGCIVIHFIGRFGLECNIGVCDPAPTMPICWCFQGDLGLPDEGQLWFVPTEDEVFYAWMTQREI